MEKETFQFPIVKDIDLITNEPLEVKPRYGNLPVIVTQKNRPLVILLTWMHAKPRHAKKFVDLYLNKGFDVLKVSSSMWHCMWPTTGAQVSATSILDFLKDNECFQPLFVHAFSCGAYVWSEVLVKVSSSMEKYESTLKRVKGQVYDSPPGIPPEFQRGFARALFPNNFIFCFLFEYAITLQLFLFYNLVTKHILNGQIAANNPPVKVPTLLFISKDDPISPFNLNMKMVDEWKKNGTQGYVKWWEHSPHVGHFVHHNEEYLAQLNTLLESVGLSNLEGPRKKDIET